MIPDAVRCVEAWMWSALPISRETRAARCWTRSLPTIWRLFSLALKRLPQRKICLRMSRIAEECDKARTAPIRTCLWMLIWIVGSQTLTPGGLQQVIVSSYERQGDKRGLGQQLT